MANPLVLWLSLDCLFESAGGPVCQSDSPDDVDSATMSREARLLFAIEVALVVQSPGTQAIVDRMLDVTRERWREQEFDLTGMRDLAKVVNNEKPFTADRQDIFADMRRALSMLPSDIGEWLVVVEVFHEILGRMEGEEFERLSEAFEAFRSEWIAEGSEDSLRAERAAFERVGKMLGIDVEDQVQSASEQIEWLEEQAERHADDSYDAWRDDQLEEEDQQATVDEMFDSLDGED